jgi:pantetheine-phosphate adenylyltransferase
MKACYPGTFDPITNGHLDLIQRASRMFDEVDVLIMKNPRKKAMFTEAERTKMIRKCVASLPNVHVVVGEGLTVDYAARTGAGVIIRGIRAVADYEYELQQATANMMLNPDIETLFFVARPAYSFLSSSVAKEIGMNGGDISKIVPAEIIPEVKRKFSRVR